MQFPPTSNLLAESSAVVVVQAAAAAAHRVRGRVVRGQGRPASGRRGSRAGQSNAARWQLVAAREGPAGLVAGRILHRPRLATSLALISAPAADHLHSSHRRRGRRRTMRYVSCCRPAGSSPRVRRKWAHLLPPGRGTLRVPSQAEWLFLSAPRPASGAQEERAQSALACRPPLAGHLLRPNSPTTSGRRRALVRRRRRPLPSPVARKVSLRERRQFEAPTGRRPCNRSPDWARA